MAERTGGEDRYGTAALVAAQVVAALRAGGSAPGGVLLASGEDAPGGIDALSASFLAGHLSAPLLLTARGGLPAPTAAALRDLLPGLPRDASGTPVVHVMGGPAVVPADVVRAVEALGARTVRVAGDDRYGTAAAAAAIGAPSARTYALVGASGGTSAQRTAIIASGTNPADALSAGPLACAARVPLLLTARDSLPDATRTALRSMAVRQVVTLGGPAAIGTAVLDALDAMGLAVLPVRGADRFDTSAVLLALACAPQLDSGAEDGEVGGFGIPFDSATTGYLANGARFPDALACGPLAGLARRPLFVTGPDALADATRSVLPGTGVRSLVGVGRSGALPDAVLDAAVGALAR
ncbi:cell wall-binding repeat-containing protein [Streptomyces sp. NP160]|uniref:cell wall-binding repeat-containing protein n=1 Tax=Streptomyces sp. NP160 TaxID=2586637 RepID=UPI0015D5AB5D|nr:cell wall-binding repeat-containing protein [Streptomyces sp. NP160]